MTLKIRSRSPKFNITFLSYKQCIYASLLKIQSLVHKITHGNHISDISKSRCGLENKVKVTKNLINSFLPSQQCIYVSLVKIHQIIQKIVHGKEAAPTLRLTSTRSAPKTIYHPTGPFGFGGHNYPVWKELKTLTVR